MTKSKLIQAVNQEAKITKNQASQTLDAIWQSIGAFFAQEESLTLIGFGTCKVSKRKARPQP